MAVSTEHKRRTLMAAAHHFNPGWWPMPPKQSKRDLQEMLRQAVENTAKQQTETTEK